MRDLGIERNKGGSYKIYVKSKVIGESVTVSRCYAWSWKFGTDRVGDTTVGEWATGIRGTILGMARPTVVLHSPI